jgi:uncharacterized metal-binding protein
MLMSVWLACLVSWSPFICFACTGCASPAELGVDVGCLETAAVSSVDLLDASTLGVAANVLSPHMAKHKE